MKGSEECLVISVGKLVTVAKSYQELSPRASVTDEFVGAKKPLFRRDCRSHYGTESIVDKSFSIVLQAIFNIYRRVDIGIGQEQHQFGQKGFAKVGPNATPAVAQLSQPGYVGERIHGLWGCCIGSRWAQSYPDQCWLHYLDCVSPAIGNKLAV